MFGSNQRNHYAIIYDLPMQSIHEKKLYVPNKLSHLKRIYKSIVLVVQNSSMRYFSLGILKFV